MMTIMIWNNERITCGGVWPIDDEVILCVNEMKPNEIQLCCTLMLQQRNQTRRTLIV